MKTVLVVDDDPVLAKVIGRMFRSDSEVTLSHSCVEALKLLAQRSFDTVVSDFELGDGYGTDVLASVPEASTKLLMSSLSYSSCCDCDPRACGYRFQSKSELASIRPSAA